MTTEALPLKMPGARRSLTRRMAAGNTIPVLTVVAAIVVIWYGAAVLANWQGTADFLIRIGGHPTAGQILAATMEQKRPVLPAPHQIFAELYRSTVQEDPTSRRSLLYHSWATLSATLAGFGMGVVLGVGLAILIVHVRTMERSLMPWIISSQTVPILAIAPIVVVVLGSLGLRGLLPKAMISAYLCFFPVAIGMVKGLNSPEVMQRDLMRSYSASRAQILWKLRLPASLPYLFAGLKVSAAISLVGTIVAELPAGSQAGLGTRLLAGSYYGQTVQIWAALFAAAILASLLVAGVTLAERITLRRAGGRP